jgi:hypothetical protein
MYFLLIIYTCMYEKFSHYKMEVLTRCLISNTYGIGTAIG